MNAHTRIIRPLSSGEVLNLRDRIDSQIDLIARADRKVSQINAAANRDALDQQAAEQEQFKLRAQAQLSHIIEQLTGKSWSELSKAMDA